MVERRSSHKREEIDIYQYMHKNVIIHMYMYKDEILTMTLSAILHAFENFMAYIFLKFEARR